MAVGRTIKIGLFELSRAGRPFRIIDRVQLMHSVEGFLVKYLMMASCAADRCFVKGGRVPESWVGSLGKQCRVTTREFYYTLRTQSDGHCESRSSTNFD